MTMTEDVGPALAARHIQNMSEGTAVPYWGYANRQMPCTSDAGSCAYLDVVYASHNRGMLYIGIFWATVGGILLLWAFIHRSSSSSEKDVVKCDSQQHDKRQSALARFSTAAQVGARRVLLPDGPHALFGRTSRLQIAILAILSGYLLLWSFVGISYQTWITPVKKSPGLYNTRTSLGPWADRIGILAYGLLPLSILLAQRESLLTMLTGVPYHHFNFLHRWLGYIILVQSLLHTIGWTIIEAKLYQPQPTEAVQWIRQPYMVWGCVAVILISLLWLLTLPPVIRRTGYEFFRKAHYVLAMLFVGACWGHWAKLRCFLIPSFVLWALDRAARLARTFLLHYNVIARPDGTTFVGFEQSNAIATLFSPQHDDDIDDGARVVRLDFDQRQTDVWRVGQHFYLTFADSSVWQSHPMTPLSLPRMTTKGTVRHSYLFRAKGGETGKVAAKLLEAQRVQASHDNVLSTNVLLTGPYGADIVGNVDAHENVLCIAGGTGITFVLPAVLHLLHSANDWHGDRRVSLVWVVRRAKDAEWIRPELELISRDRRIDVQIHSTRDGQGQRESAEQGSLPINVPELSFRKRTESGVATTTMEKEARVEARLTDHRPNLAKIVSDFLYNAPGGPSTIMASGPGSMLSELRTVVARSNDVRRALRGEERASVRFVSDNRLEW